MKKLLFYFFSATILLVAGCSESFDDSQIWTKLDSLESRIAALEQLCRQMNTNISSLQTVVDALKNNDYVTSVTPITEDGKTIGYTITFSKSSPVTIYHGKDGANGADGKDGVDGKDGADGYTPVIGVKQDVDGIYYWTLDGEWLLDNDGNKIKAEGKDGKDGQDGKDGEDGVDGKDGEDGKDGKDGEDGKDGKDGIDGADGKDGKDGKDGVTPQLKIENEYWYISYDNGATWTELGKATGEDGQDGTDGKDGQNGDSMFEDVTYDDDYVYFTLTDGTVITIPRASLLDSDTPPNNEIWYTSSDGQPIEISRYNDNHTPTIADFGGANIISNVYKDGKGVITFDSEVKSIPDFGYSGETRLISILLPNSIKAVGQRAIYRCENLEYIRFPENLSYIGASAFERLESLYSITIPDIIPDRLTYQLRYSKNLTYVYGKYATYDNKYLIVDREIKLAITKGIERCNLGYLIGLVDSIGPYAFIPNNDTKVITDFFGVEYFGDGAFAGMEALETVNLCQNVELGNGVFQDCINLTTIGGLWYITRMGRDTFSGCTGLTDITIPSQFTSIEQGTFSGCTGLKTVTIPNNVTEIGTGAFQRCTNLESIKIPAGVTVINEGTFQECSNLTEVSLHSGITKIGHMAFFACENLNITLPEGIKIIGPAAFTRCGFTTITIPNSVTTIENSAFVNNKNLTDVHISSTCGIGNNAFGYCEALVNVYCSTTQPPYSYWQGKNFFYEVSADLKIYVPTESVDTYKTANVWKDYADKIVGYDF